MMNKMRKPRSGSFVLLAVLSVGMLIQGAVHINREIKENKNDIGYAPAFVTYGTHSTATVPLLSAPRRTGVPMVSAAAVRHAAYAGHASVAPAAGGIHTTSSAQVRSVGTGIGGSGVASAMTASSAQRGITYGGASVSVPMLAINTVVASPAQTVESGTRAAGPRRILPNGDGSYNGETKEEGGNTYYWDEDANDGEGGWINNTPVGTTKTVDGVTWEWDGTKWVKKTGTDPGPSVPVGTAPWLLLVLLAALYTVRKKSRRA